MNDPQVTETVTKAFTQAFGADRVHELAPVPASEDFSIIPGRLRRALHLLGKWWLPAGHDCCGESQPDLRACDPADPAHRHRSCHRRDAGIRRQIRLEPSVPGGDEVALHRRDHGAQRGRVVRRLPDQARGDVGALGQRDERQAAAGSGRPCSWTRSRLPMPAPTNASIVVLSATVVTSRGATPAPSNASSTSRRIDHPGADSSRTRCSSASARTGTDRAPASG